MFEKLYQVYHYRFQLEHNHYDELMNWDLYEAYDSMCEQIAKADRKKHSNLRIIK